MKLVDQHDALRYILSGGVTFGADYCVFLLVTYVLDAGVVFGTTAGYVTGLVISFTFNRQWVFKTDGNKRKPVRQLAEYVILLLFNYVFTVIFVREGAHILPAYIVKLASMIIVAGWNYVLYKKIIFRAQSAG